MAEIRTLDLVVDRATGTQLYEAYQDITAGNIYVRQLDQTLALQGSVEDFDVATETQMDARTYKLALYTCNDPSQSSNEDYVIAYGRMQKA